jgi:hypothetical protein
MAERPSADFCSGEREESRFLRRLCPAQRRNDKRLREQLLIDDQQQATRVPRPRIEIPSIAGAPNPADSWYRR